MSFKIPTFCKVLAKFGPFLLLGGKLSVSASHRFSCPDDFSTFVRTIVRTTFFPKSEIFVKVLKYLSEQRYPLTSPYTIYHDEEDHLLLQYHRGSGHTYCCPRPQGSLTNKFSAPKSSALSEHFSGRKKSAKIQRSNEYAGATVLERVNSQHAYTHRLPS